MEKTNSICVICGTAYHARPDRKKSGRSKCCSRACSNKNKVADKNPNWKGGNVRYNKYIKKYNARNPEKIRAKNLINHKKRRNILVMEPCLYCGSPKAEAHHPDYSSPLNVVWLCKPCHASEHKRMGCRV